MVRNWTGHRGKASAESAELARLAGFEDVSGRGTASETIALREAADVDEWVGTSSS